MEVLKGNVLISTVNVSRKQPKTKMIPILIPKSKGVPCSLFTDTHTYTKENHQETLLGFQYFFLQPIYHQG